MVSVGDLVFRVLDEETIALASENCKGSHSSSC